ncbi:MAG: T9SS type A sorting domain-containing protein [Bacteroidota bacterium]
MMKTKFILCSCLLFSLTTLWSQIEFEERVILDYSAIPNGPNYAEPADMDGDGDLDLLITSSGDFRVSWLENEDGEGNYGARHIINSEQLFGMIDGQSGDVDGDGDLDVIVAATLGVWWYENLDGAGNFGPRRRVTDRSGNNSMAVGDLDGDGDPDLIITGYIAFEDDVLVFRNNNGGFSQGQTLTKDMDEVRLFDVDLDGDLDAVTVGYRSMRWYPNNGDGTFGTGVTVSSLAFLPIGGYVGDVDGDTDMDFLTVSREDSTLVWFENLGNNMDFSDPHPIALSYPVDVGVIRGEDIDLDGDLDIWLGKNDDSALELYLNDGSANFNAVPAPATENGISMINYGDLDGDGDLDLILVSTIQDHIVWLENLDGKGDYGEENRLYPDLPNGIRHMELEDLDKDGDLDVLIGSTIDGQISWLEKLGPGVYRPYEILVEGIRGFTAFEVGDLNGDGHLDLMVATGESKEIVWFEHLDGLISFSPKRLIAQFDEETTDVSMRDLNNDGIQDVLYAREGWNGLGWLRHMDGQGSFGNPIDLISNSRDGSAIIAADMDNDGDQDIIGGIGLAFYFENIDGAGTFGDRQILRGISGLREIEAVDLDEDNDLDLLFAGGSSARFIENLGGGNFEEGVYVGSLRRAESITAVDLNQDGRLDILGANSESHTVKWFERVSDSLAFGTDQLVAAQVYGAHAARAEDVDLDGDMDVLTASLLENKITWFANLYPNGNQVRGAVRYDFDQNGCTATDPVAKHLLIGSSDGSTNIGAATNTNGFYQLFPGEGSYTTQITSTLPDYFTSQPQSYDSDFTGFGQIDTADFCLVATQEVDDVAISLYSIRTPRPGFTTTFRLVYRNLGTTTQSGDLGLSFDPNLLSFVSASEGPLNPAAAPLQWSYANLLPFETRWIALEFQVKPPPTVNIGDVLELTATITPASDENPADNSFELREQVIGAYDPNDITVLEGPLIEEEETENYLHYLIRFQNTGTAEAIIVRVENELDERLDWSTFQLEATSHDMEIETKENRQFSFIFNNIYLPDSNSNLAASIGFIAYRIKPLPGFAVGDTIYNQADIYFDFNPPIITNEVNTTVRRPVSTQDLSRFAPLIYPNPTGSWFSIQNTEPIERIELYDLYGKMVREFQPSAQLDISDLSAGAYMVWCYGRNGESGVGKLIKS